MPNRRCLSYLLPALCLTSSSDLRAGDWSQWLGGPHRFNRAESAPLRPEPFSSIDYQLAWRLQLGLGYSSIIVHGANAVAAYAGEESDMIALLDAATGKRIWTAPIGKASGDGPLATPAAGDGRIFAISGRGELHALRLADGAPIWRRDLVTDFGTKPGFMASSPLLVRDRIIVLAGGDNGKSVVALSASDGKVLWTSQSDEIDCGSPTLAVLDGVEQVVAVAKKRVFAVRLSDGELLWSLEATVDPWATPLALGNDRIFLPMRFEHMVVECKRSGDGWNVRKVWVNPELNGNGSSYVHVHDLLIGSTDQGLVCLDAKTGRLRWRDDGPEGAVTLVDGQIAFIDRDTGSVSLLPASAELTLRSLEVRPRLGAGGWTPVTTSGTDLFVRSGNIFARFKRKPVDAEEAAAARSPQERPDTSRQAPSHPESIESFARRLRAGDVALFGELHGTEEAPAFVANVAEEAARNGATVRIGLEMTAAMQPAVDAFLRSDGTPGDYAALTQHPFWRIHDGRSSVAMLSLIDKARRLRHSGNAVDVFLFDITGGSIRHRDEGMANNILAAVKAAPDAIHLILTGNLHARTNSPRYMGWHILRRHKNTIALNLAHGGGSAWISSDRGIGAQNLSGSDRGTDQFVEWLKDWDGQAYHGIYYVSRITASPPAVSDQPPEQN